MSEREDSQLDSQLVARETEFWVRDFVIGHNLCPFAARELRNERVRFTVTRVASEHDLLVALHDELGLLNSSPELETTLLVHPQVLQDFKPFNQFLALADALLIDMGFEGVFQIASFHPGYCFDNVSDEDVSNKTNRSPYPTLQILREASIEHAVSNYPEIDELPMKNVETMNRLLG